MNVKLPGGYLERANICHLHLTGRHLGASLWVLHLSVAVRFPRVIPLFCIVHGRVGGI